MAVSLHPQRVLVVRLSHLGDIAQAIPLIHAIREAWPGADLAWAVQPEFASLVAPLARVIPFDRRGGLGAWRSLRRAFREWQPDLVLDAQGNWKSATCARIAARAGGGARSIAFARTEWQEPLAARLTRPEHAPRASAPHLVARCAALAQHAIGRAVRPRLDPDLSVDELARGRELLGALNAPIVLHPGVLGDPRSWPAAGFEALARSLDARGAQVVVLTGPGEASVGRELERALPSTAHIVGQRGLRDLAALFAAVHARGGRLVAGDSGPAHVAASVGLPVVLLAGPEDPARTGPWPTVGSPGSPHALAAPPWSARRVDEIGVDAALAAIAASLSD